MPDTNLNPDGPHSPDRTKEVAGLFAECVRFLNYASNGGPGLNYPGDVYSLGLCSCGETSPELDTDADRKRWHAGHKQAVREQLEVRQ